MVECPSCGRVYYSNGQCEDCTYNWHTGRQPTPPGKDEVIQLKRIADVLEKIERHMSFNNGTLDGLTRNYDPGRR